MPIRRFFLPVFFAAAATATAPAHKQSDYVIVGGGPAGFVLAEQLSRDPNTQVILLEAGPDAIDSVQVNSRYRRSSVTVHVAD